MKNIEAINDNIHINQIGYRPGDTKVAIINGRGGKFVVINTENGDEVYTGTAEGGEYDEASGDYLFYADFSDIINPGTYYVKIPDFGRSYSFTVGDGVYRDIKNILQKALYFQRCGVNLDEKHAGLWKHSACHLSKGRVYDKRDTELDGSGGWHDAGDYSKYTVPGAVTAAYLLISYEFFPQAYTEELNIPESGNGMPDILNEAKYELDWLLKMQDTVTGGVYHKLASEGFPDEMDPDKKIVMPQEDSSDQYFFRISSTATADFAAIMALASGIYRQFNPEYSEKCLHAAEKAWVWLKNNNNTVKFVNPPGVISGRYGDEYDRDERYWAASELYGLTGKQEYHEYFLDSLEKDDTEAGMMWQHVGGFGDIAYLLANKVEKNPAALRKIRDRLMEMANSLDELSKQNSYRITLTPDWYDWGSNLYVLNSAFYLIIAGLLFDNYKYIQSAQDQFHYLLGRNAINQVYVTGVGSKPVMHPHHRPSEGDGVEEPIPGLVIGGPNQHLQDEYTRLNAKGTLPARCYLDHVLSCSTNETAIYWIAPAVFIAGYFDSQQPTKEVSTDEY